MKKQSGLFYTSIMLTSKIEQPMISLQLCTDSLRFCGIYLYNLYGGRLIIDEVQVTTAIRIENLSKSFGWRTKKRVHAVKNLNLEIKAGQVYGFLDRKSVV